MPDFTSTVVRKARKDHHCTTCGRVIEAGESYRRGAGFEDGTAWSWKDCEHCAAVVTLWPDSVQPDEGYNGDTFDAWVDCRNDIYASMAGWLDAAELRAMAGYKHRWRTAQGNLWPIPVRTKYGTND